MSQSPLRVLLVVRDHSDHITQAGLELVESLRRESRFELIGIVGTDDVQPANPAELVVVLGGDGTILRTCRQLGPQQRPILGVNLGRLGFLADLSPAEFLDRLAELAERRFQVIHHLMFSCLLRRTDGPTETHVGLNEVAVLSAGSLQMLRVDLSIDGERVTTFRGDGLIVATPVGSTAHSLAAGGPILKQDLQAFVITPISPHTLTNRPLVDRADCVYTLAVPEAVPGVMLVIDGQIRRPLSAGDCVEVRRAAETFQLARLSHHSYYGTLYRKLGWGGQTRHGN
uniref:NAD kinase n=1 Tax=Schlesneria paludicola TaxID=360056 RepID=A0A7C4QTB1_9PLAN